MFALFLTISLNRDIVHVDVVCVRDKEDYTLGTKGNEFCLKFEKFKKEKVDKSYEQSKFSSELFFSLVNI